MHRHRAEEAADGVGAAADLGAGAGGQEAEAQLAQERQAPLVVGEAGAGFAFGQVRGGGAELRPVLAQAVPRLGDDFVQALALRQAVVLGPRAVELCLGVEHAPQQVGRQEAAFGADGLEVLAAARHGQFNLGNRT